MRLRAITIVLPVLVGLTLLGEPAEASSRHYEDVLDITFPSEPESARSLTNVDGQNYGFMNDYHHGRGNGCGIHRATDVFGPHGQKVYAAEGGEVTWLSTGSHYIIEITDDDGYRYRYMHLGRSNGPRDQAFAPGIDRGVRVERGEHIGYVGSSGNAHESNPHLHFEIHHQDLTDTPCQDNGWGYYNPYYSLQDAVERGDLPTGGSAEPEPLPEHVGRIAGPTRMGTAAELASASHPHGADHVVVAPAYRYAEGLVAGPLAAAVDGAVLTTTSDRLHGRALEALQVLDPDRVTLVGDEDALAAAVADAIVAEGVVDADGLDRIAGDTPAGTAAAVADEVLTRTEADEVVVTRGADPTDPSGWPDALAGSWYGSVTGTPVLLATPDALPEATAAALDDLNVERATVLGGTAAISDQVLAAVGEHVDDVTRRHGDSRFATARAVASDLLDRGLVNPNEVWAATGHEFADALTAGPVVDAGTGALVLVDGAGTGSDGMDGWLRDHADRFSGGTVIGGASAISDDTKRRLGDLIE